MPITSNNFYHIQTVEPDIDVLFFVDFDGDNTIIHQMTVCSVGTIDLKISIPGDKLEELWPDKIQFKEAAYLVIKTIQDMGFTFESEVADA